MRLEEARPHEARVCGRGGKVRGALGAISEREEEDGAEEEKQEKSCKCDLHQGIVKYGGVVPADEVGKRHCV